MDFSGISGPVRLPGPNKNRVRGIQYPVLITPFSHHYFSSMQTLSFLLLVALPFCFSDNPVVANVGMADPHVHVFEGQFFMYATHDFSNNNTNFLMKDWWVWSSPDLVAWTQESILLPQNTPSPQSAWDECWATDGATSNGSYFFYLSIGGNQVAVVNSSISPKGPWDNALGVPLLPASLGSSLNPPTTIRDPAVFLDADGSHYILFGVFVYYIAKLGPDMMSLAETPKLVTVNNALGTYGPGKTDDKPFLHAANGLYYLSWGCFYGIGESPYGPFNYSGSAILTEALDPAFQMNQTSGPWWSWEDTTDRHGSFWTANGQSYFASNDRSHSTDLKGRAYFRDVAIGYVHYLPNNTIAPVEINAVGVGQYEAEGGRLIKAENFFELESVGQVARKGYSESRNRFGVYGLTHNSNITYPNIRHALATTMMKLQQTSPPRLLRLNVNVSNGGAQESVLIASRRSITPSSSSAGTAISVEFLCSIPISPYLRSSTRSLERDGWNDFKALSCEFDASAFSSERDATGIDAFHLIFQIRQRGAAAGDAGEELMRIESFSIATPV